ncbi:calcium release-activated calcium channel protein 1 [Procambarus clarkii]|uniref:calcium release-activated calcium channel protein 1 n=1 Tax=Procambarus clarkii TaxID=6728 RepID=UPI00374319EA
MVSVHLLALMISICILPYVDIVVSLGIVDSGGNLHGSKGNFSESPHIKMHGFIEASWIMSNILGLLIFMVFMGLLSWIKFLDYSRNAAVGSTTILVPFLIIFTAFAIHFYYKLVKHKVKSAGKSLNEIAVGLEELQKYGSTYSIQIV